MVYKKYAGSGKFTKQQLIIMNSKKKEENQNIENSVSENKGDTFNRKCAICQNRVTKDANRDSPSIPSYIEHSALCHECTGEGWKFCDVCKKPFNINKVQFKNFQLKISLNYVNEDSVNKNRYCSNECYNFESIDREIGFLRTAFIGGETQRIIDNAKEKIAKLEKLKSTLLNKC